LAEVGILIVDNDVTNQRALKNILDSEGWRVRIVQEDSQALAELATGNWSLAIVNAAFASAASPLFPVLKELNQADPLAMKAEGAGPPKGFRTLFLVPAANARQLQPLLEREGVPYSIQPYHLHDFLEKISELLVEAGAISQPLRSISGLSPVKKKRQEVRSREGRRGSMFASREDYQMTEEEMVEFERQEEEDRKKRIKAIKDREHL
jgi:CheY-like chemotaxis protein